jgi:hypothetical protein
MAERGVVVLQRLAIIGFAAEYGDFHWDDLSRILKKNLRTESAPAHRKGVGCVPHRFTTKEKLMPRGPALPSF